MYFDFEDYRPDIYAGRPRHLVARGRPALDHLPPGDGDRAPDGAGLARRDRGARSPKPSWPRNDDKDEPLRFVFVQPRVDTASAEAAAARRPVRQGSHRAVRRSGPRTRRIRCRSRAAIHRSGSNECPRNVARGRGAEPEPQAGQQAEPSPPPARAGAAVCAAAACAAAAAAGASGAGGRAPAPGGSLGDALRNLQRYVQNEQFDNPQGERRRSARRFSSTPRASSSAAGSGGSSRRSSATGSDSLRGDVDERARRHQFNVHKNGTITDLTIVGRAPIEAFNNAAFGALVCRTRRSRCRRSIRPTRRFSPSRSSTTKRRSSAFVAVRASPLRAPNPDALRTEHRTLTRTRTETETRSVGSSCSPVSSSSAC